MKKKNETSWGQIAEEYDAAFTRSGSYLEAVIAPNFLRMLSPQKGEHIADIGCGSGFLSRLIAKEGAYVSASDISGEMIAIAKGGADKNISYTVASSDRLPYKAGSFDAAVCALALQNIEHLSETMKEVKRILKKNARFVFVVNHPVLRAPKKSSWGWDEALQIQFRRLDGYMSESTERIDMDPGKRAGKRVTISHHRPLQTYFKALVKNGFAIVALEEWISHRKSEKGPRAQAEDKARKEFPLFLAVTAIRL